ncbi:MAG TPA: tryptophan 7-halogenase [Acidimicrobiales bacterium]|nr:tryptophan 7-halogenase [Acidimicrobiales bacterium]
MPHVAIIGGSVAGLATGVALARRGWQATIVERDLGPETDDGDDAFLVWDRRNVPQFRQPHAFSSRSRTLLLTYIPEVVDRLRADGIEEVNLFKMLAPPDLWSDEDDAYTGLWSRRPAFELAIRRTAESEPGVSIRAPEVVDGLVTRGAGGDVHVIGIRLSDGSQVEADLVVDCGGRRSLTPRWLGELGIEVTRDRQDCGAVYYSRYYRLRADSPLSPFGILALGSALDGVNVLGFPGDHRTYGLAAFIRPQDEELKMLREDFAWNAVMGAVPRLAPWADPDNGTPLTDVQYMGGHHNVRWRYVVDGRPVVKGLLPVGDALCTTNPMYGWGASMALTYAFAAVEAANAHRGDLEATALAYDESVCDEADAVYRESAAMDRIRGYRWRGEEVPDWERAEVERQDLIACILAGALRDPVLGRATLRRQGLLEAPSTVLDDPEVLEHAKNTQAILAAKSERVAGPTRLELVEAIARART